MTEFDEIRKRVLVRLDIIQMYMVRGMDVTMFTRLYNAGDISRQLREETGPIDAEDLDRWVTDIMEIGI